MVFDSYSKYYDLLYKDKDYEAEASYIKDILARYSSQDGKKLFEMGCGTGKHAKLLHDFGYSVVGIDFSETMLGEAKKFEEKGLEFSYGDVRDFDAEKTFDNVISLFHIASYQTSNESFMKYLKNARKHLDKGGLFVFDVWYLPCVLSLLPENRVKKMENDEISVERFARPVHKINENVVEVNYEINITDKKTGELEKLNECHPMRYFSKPEIELALDCVGFELLGAEEWLTKCEPSKDTWGVCFVAKAK